MVYKVDKHGVRTGNTFKRWNTKYYRQYKKQTYISRSHIVNAENDNQSFDDIVAFRNESAFGEGRNMADGIEYSLNKQRRWELPDILEEIILCSDSEKDYGIQLVQRHRINHLANCVKVCSSEGVYKGGNLTTDRKFKIKSSGGYFQSNSVLKRAPVVSKKKQRQRRRNRLQTEENDEEEQKPIPESNKLRYEVHYPSPVTSFLTHKSSTIGMYIDKDPRKRRKRRERMSGHIKESLQSMNDSFDDSEEEDSVHEADDIEHEERDYMFTLDDILKHANVANKLTSRKVRNNSDTSISSTDSDELSSAKGRVVYLDRNEAVKHDANAASKQVLTTKKESIKLQPVRVILKDEAVNQSTLAQIYGKDFIECDCFPRKFLLNISSQASNLNMFKTVCKSSRIHTEACIVFVHDVDNDVNNLNENVYKVFLNANFGENLNSVQIETIFDYMETSIEEVIERALFFIETLPVESVECERDSFTHRVLGKGSALEECANWKVESYQPNNTFLFDLFLSRVPTLNHATNMGFEVIPQFDAYLEDQSDNVTSPKDRFCCICYTTLGDSDPGTALISCSHWFCDVCWKEYLETQVHNGAENFQCPEFDCDKNVDPGTILSLISVRDVIKHTKCCHDTHVEQQKCTKWCPNEKCGRVLKRNCEDAKNSQCVCGIKVCFECLQTPHWPASCDSVQNYYKKMRETGDIAFEPPELRKQLIVRGKNCPSCHRFIEKNGGCPSMICVCNAQFCWGCGQLWGERLHGHECYRYGYNDNHGTTERTFNTINPLERRNRQKWYKMALVHRINQHAGRQHTLKTAVKPLAKKLQCYIVKAENQGEIISFDFDFANKTFLRQTDRTTCFVKNTIDLYVEINHVVENTSVLLNSEQLPSGYRLVLQHISYRLSSFSNAIYELFMSHESFNGKDLFKKLKDVRFHTRNTFQSLIRCIKSLKS